MGRENREIAIYALARANFEHEGRVEFGMARVIVSSAGVGGGIDGDVRPPEINFPRYNGVEIDDHPGSCFVGNEPSWTRPN